MKQASVTQIGQVPTRAFVYDGGKERTVRLTADLRLKMQDIAMRTNEGLILSGEAARLSCIAIFGEQFWDKVPFDMASQATDFAVEVMKEILGVEDADEKPAAKDTEQPPEPDSKNAEPPQQEG